MGDLSEFSLATRLFLKAYRWRRIDPVPCAPLRKPMWAGSSDPAGRVGGPGLHARLALVTTAGLHLPQQPPFDNDLRGGDTSYRVIPNDADVSTLLESHRSETFDHAGVQSDANLAFPLDRLREMQLNLAPRHLSFMGSITAPGRLTSESAREAAQLLVDDGVEAALLVPI